MSATSKVIVIIDGDTREYDIAEHKYFSLVYKDGEDIELTSIKKFKVSNKPKPKVATKSKPKPVQRKIFDICKREEDKKEDKNIHLKESSDDFTYIPNSEEHNGFRIFLGHGYNRGCNYGKMNYKQFKEIFVEYIRLQEWGDPGDIRILFEEWEQALDIKRTTLLVWFSQIKLYLGEEQISPRATNVWIKKYADIYREEINSDK